MNALTTTGGASFGGPLMPQNMNDAIRMAEMMAKGKIGMPEHLRGNPGDCLMVVEQAMRWRMSPWAVAQCTSSIKGKLMYEGKLVAAAVETSGALAGLLDYQLTGTGSDRKVTVIGTRVGEREPKTVEVVLKDAITDNGIWKKQPDQQLCYHGARVWARRWTPAVMLGVYAPDEFDAEPRTTDTFVGTTINAEPQTRDSINAETAPKPRTRADWLAELDADLHGCTTKDEVEGRLAAADVVRALAEFTNGVKLKLDAVMLTHRKRVGVVLDDPDSPREMNT